MAGGFDANTRLRKEELGAMVRPVGDVGLVQSIDLPRIGMLARIWLRITGTVTGPVSNLNVLGMSSIIKRVSLIANDGPHLVNISGPGYYWQLIDYLDAELAGVAGYLNGRSSIAAGAFDISMMLPLQVNRRDPVGLIRLASNVNTFRLEIEWELQGVVATGAVIAATCSPVMEFFSIPADPADWPPTLETIGHVILEETQAISAVGEYRYAWPRQNVYLQVLHGAGFGIGTTVPLFDRVAWVINRQDYIENVPTLFKQNLDFGFWHGRAPAMSTVAFDLIGSSGLGDYGTMRDTFDSADFTDVETVINFVTAPTTLRTIRRQLVRLPRRG